MRIYDRLYKEITFPSIIMDLLNCPGLLRLRDVRMANNQLVAFPSFGTVTRYEHSIGVCYLAGLCSESLDLNEKDTLELMIAGLYHDVGTPPFAHAMEEVLKSKFNFDHEKNLKQLIIGDTGEFDGELAQIFQGEGLKLRSVCQSKYARNIGLDPYRIANIVAGDDNIVLSKLINGKEIDLDNIDNIFRASSAMGIISLDCGKIAKTLARSFILEDDNLYYNGLNESEIREWLNIRDLQYTAIFNSVEDFSYQTMIKKALNILLDDIEENVDVNLWRLTDSTLTYDFLLKNEKSKKIMKRVLLCKPYNCLGIMYISGKNTTNYINNNLQKIENIASEFYILQMGLSDKKLNSIDTNPVVVNFFPDKRKREIKNKALLWNKEQSIVSSQESINNGVLLGFFTPYDNSNYITTDNKRKKIIFDKELFNSLMKLLSSNVLQEFDITEYRSSTYEQNYSIPEAYQLGLF